MEQTNSIEYITWRKLYTIILKVANRIINDGYKPDIIYAVVKGGLIPARILMDLLGVDELGLIGVKYYTGINTRRDKPLLSLPPTLSVVDKRILVVDDIVDTGETLRLVVEELSEQEPSCLRTVVLYVKPWTHFKPNYYYGLTTKWIVFPWELGETIRQGIHLSEEILGEDYEQYKNLVKLLGFL